MIAAFSILISFLFLVACTRNLGCTRIL